MAVHLASPKRPSIRIAAIDWMRGLVMILMILDHASMAFDGDHLAKDSALYADAATMALPAGEFFTRWVTHICAPTFVFLAGLSLALSVERRMASGDADACARAEPDIAAQYTDELVRNGSPGAVLCPRHRGTFRPVGPSCTDRRRGGKEKAA